MSGLPLRRRDGPQLQIWNSSCKVPVPQRSQIISFEAWDMVSWGSLKQPTLIWGNRQRDGELRAAELGIILITTIKFKCVKSHGTLLPKRKSILLNDQKKKKSLTTDNFKRRKSCLQTCTVLRWEWFEPKMQRAFMPTYLLDCHCAGLFPGLMLLGDLTRKYYLCDDSMFTSMQSGSLGSV